MENKEIILQLIFVLLAAVFGGIGGSYIQNQYSEESLESELVIIDLHLEEKEYIQIKDQMPFNISMTKIDDGKEINFSLLEVNITVVNSVYSKYPTKICYSKIDLKGGNKKTSDNVLEYGLENINYTFIMGETTPILARSSSEPIYPSKHSTITQYVILPSEGNYNLTGFFYIWYYDPMTNKLKCTSDEAFILQIKSGKLERITPLKEYVTIKGYKIEDYEFAIYK